jgi:hypothetical protein
MPRRSSELDCASKLRSFAFADGCPTSPVRCVSTTPPHNRPPREVSARRQRDQASDVDLKSEVIAGRRLCHDPDMAESPTVTRRTPAWRLKLSLPLTVRHRRTHVLTTLQDASDFVLNVLDSQDLQKLHWQVAIAALLEAAEECSNEAIQDATLELHRALSRDSLL